MQYLFSSPLTTMKQTERFTALDGLRGIAIIAVMLSHMQPVALTTSLPSGIGDFVHMLFNNGLWGVTWLFILSGFLMAYLYPQPSKSFLIKRYARIFPLFLAMSFAMWVYWLMPELSFLTRIAVLGGVALLVHAMWKGVQYIDNKKLNTWLFYAFLTIQISTLLWYVVIVMRHPPIWFQDLPFGLYEATVYLVNTTLTFPFGNYIPMLDGVYWSLAAEIFFYILYPYTFAPILQRLEDKPYATKIVFILLGFAFFGGIHILAEQSKGFATFQLEYFFSFLCGTMIGVLARQRPVKRLPLSLAVFGHPFVLVIYFILFSITLGAIPIFYTTYLFMAWSVPFGITIYALLDPYNPYTTLYRSRSLLYLGMISYAVYLSHVPIIHAVELLLFSTSNTWTSSLSFVLLTTILSIIAGSVLHYLLEKPYFSYKKKHATKIVQQPWNVSYLPMVGTLTFVILCSVFLLYQSRFNFFSTVYTYGINAIASSVDGPQQQHISLKEYTDVRLEFIAKENNLGIIALPLEYTSSEKITVMPQPDTELLLRIKEQGSDTWYAESVYPIQKIGQNSILPFGFPLIADAQGRTYLVNLSLSNSSKDKDLLLRTQPYTFQTVHQKNKKELLTNPRQIGEFIANKLQTITNHHEVPIVLAHTIPFLLFLWYLVDRKKTLYKS